MNEEKKIFAGTLFCPADPELKAIKLKTHNLCYEYNKTFEDETEKRTELINRIFGKVGKGVFFQGPIYIHYGTHTSIGDSFFGNFNITIQDDAPVTIGLPPLRLGERVRVNGGKLIGLEGNVFREEDGNTNLVITIDILGCAMVKIARDLLDPIKCMNP